MPIIVTIIWFAIVVMISSIIETGVLMVFFDNIKVRKSGFFRYFLFIFFMNLFTFYIILLAFLTSRMVLPFLILPVVDKILLLRRMYPRFQYDFSKKKVNFKRLTIITCVSSLMGILVMTASLYW
jgi:hypothetical protein